MTDTLLAVITGGTKGIGRATIEAFAAAGFAIATCARNSDELNKLKHDVEARYGVEVTAVMADLSSSEDTQEFVDAILQLPYRLAVLINNAGVFFPGEAHTEADGLLEQQIETNLYSAYRMCRALIPQMKTNGKGHIFNICSIASQIAYPNGGSYTISKFALYGMSKVLREELKPHNIRVTSVLPGATLTASWEGVDLPAERFIPPQDVATMILTTYQLSPRSVVEDLVIRPQLGDI